MKDFNHKKAWRELAAPLLMELPLNIKRLVSQVMRDSRGLQQNKDLSMPWPESSNLREKFEEIPTEDLARAARIVWGAGHWHPGTNNWFRPLMRTGAYWKFASYADEILREKLGLDRHSRAKNGCTFELHEGFLRVCVSFDRSWSWYEVALATPENLDKLEKLIPVKYNTLDYDPDYNDKKNKARQESYNKSIAAYWKVIEAAVEKMKVLRPPRIVDPNHHDGPCAHMASCMVDDPITTFFDLEEFYDERN
jgi:hypothetical protein